MKLALTLLIILASAQVFADYRCVNQVSPERTESALIQRFPNLNISRGYSECTKADPTGTATCSMGTIDTIASPLEVCGVSIDATHNCTVTESVANGGHALKVECNERTRAVFRMNKNDEGSITCFHGRFVVKSWNVGTCDVVP